MEHLHGDDGSENQKHHHGHHHAHGHHGHHHSRSEAPEALKRAIAVTLIFMVLELVGGWYSNSLALISDGAHMLTDVGAMLLSLFAIWISRKPASQSMTFGYHRAEILGALTSGLIIWLISGFLIYEAIVRLREPPAVKAPAMTLIAVIGLLANLISMRILHHAKHHNMNVRAAYLHIFADALGSVGAVIAGIALWLTDWRPIDPIVSILFAALMLVSSWELVKEAVGVLMESTPTGVDTDKVRKDLEGIGGVREAHDLHIWTVSSGRLALSVHLIATAEPEKVLASAHAMLQERYGIIHTTVQIEHPDKFQSDRCYDCAPIELKSAR